MDTVTARPGTFDQRIVLMQVRAEARQIVRDGLRKVAPDAVAAVERAEEQRQRRVRDASLLEMRLGMQVIDPSSFVRGVFL